MNKIKFGIATILLAGFGLQSCIDHEVIPAPTPTVELKCHFLGTINNTDIEFTQNVNGYFCDPNKAKYILPSPQWSTAVYYSEIKSAQSSISVKIGLGSATWDAASASDPTLTIFNTFFTNNLTPFFSNNGTAGFEFRYKDASGRVWASHENSVNAQNVVFSNTSQESDVNGDYSKFTCTFNCYVYHQDQVTLDWDSLRVQNATFKGWFKR